MTTNKILRNVSMIAIAMVIVALASYVCFARQIDPFKSINIGHIKKVGFDTVANHYTTVPHGGSIYPWWISAGVDRKSKTFLVNVGEPVGFDLSAWLTDQHVDGVPDFEPKGSGKEYTLNTDVNFYAKIQKFSGKLTPKQMQDNINNYNPAAEDLFATWKSGTALKAGERVDMGSKDYTGSTSADDSICIFFVSKWSGGIDRNSICALVSNSFSTDIHTEAKINNGAYSNSPIQMAFPGDRVWWRHTANFSGSSLSSDVRFQLHNTYKSQFRDTILTSWKSGSSVSGNTLLHEGYYVYSTPLLVTDDMLGSKMCESVTGLGAVRTSPTEDEIKKATCTCQLHDKVSDIDSNEVCVQFAYHYTRESPHMPAQKDCTFYGNCPGNKLPNDYNAALRVNTQSDVDHVLVGDRFRFTDWVHHLGGRTKSKEYDHRGFLSIVKGSSVNDGNQAGPLVYPTTNIFDVGCMPNSKYRHGLKKDDIKSCISLCVHEDINDPSTPCVKSRPSIKPGGMDGIYHEDILDQSWFDSAGAKLGDKICEWSAITNWQAVNGDIAPSVMVSNMICIDIAKMPQIRILGGDTISSKSIIGSNYGEGNNTNFDRGSWSQYGLFAGDNIRYFGSAGFTVVHKDSNPLFSNRFKSCYLDFANGKASSSNDCDVGAVLLGKFGIKADDGNVSMPVINNRFVEKITQDDFDLSSVNSGERIYRYTGTGKVFRLHGNLRPGVHTAIEIPKDVAVEITGDIGLIDNAGRPVLPKDMQYKFLGDLPTFSLIAHDDITINGSVKQVFGNLVAKQHIYTCAEAKAGLKKSVENPALGEIGPCNKELTVYGSLMSGGAVNFYRTFGSDLVSSKAKNPSETIVYMPTNFLLPNIGLNSEGSDYVTTYVKDMTPRY